MKRHLLATATVGALLVTGSLAAGAMPVSAATIGGDTRPATPVILVAGAAPSQPTVVGHANGLLGGKVAPKIALDVAPSTATFPVSYTGFSPEAQAAFQRAVDIWSTQITSSIPITVSARFTPLGANVLGSAGPSSLRGNFTGAEQRNTYYPEAIANKQAGRQLDPSADINANFSSNFTNWYFGSGAAPRNTYDFTTVVLHELGHGLGFIGAGTVNSFGLGSVRYGSAPLAYDTFTRTGSGTSLQSLPNNSTSLASQLRSGNLYFDSPQVRAANGGTPAKLFAPTTWSQGSSYSHLDEATYPAGDINSLMTPSIGPGETIRTPGPIALAVFDSVGW